MNRRLAKTFLIGSVIQVIMIFNLEAKQVRYYPLSSLTEKSSLVLNYSTQGCFGGSYYEVLFTKKSKYLVANVFTGLDSRESNYTVDKLGFTRHYGKIDTLQNSDLKVIHVCSLRLSPVEMKEIDSFINDMREYSKHDFWMHSTTTTEMKLKYPSSTDSMTLETVMVDIFVSSNPIDEVISNCKRKLTKKFHEKKQ